jgi:hypothetical protein
MVRAKIVFESILGALPLAEPLYTYESFSSLVRRSMMGALLAVIGA